MVDHHRQQLLAAAKFLEGRGQRRAAGVVSVEHVAACGGRVVVHRAAVKDILRHPCIGQDCRRRARGDLHLVGAVDQRDRDGVAAHLIRAGVHIGIGADACLGIQRVDQRLDRRRLASRIDEVVLDLDQAQDVGIKPEDRIHKLVQLPCQFIIRIGAARIEAVFGRHPGQVDGGEEVEDVETRDLQGAVHQHRFGRAGVVLVKAVRALFGGPDAPGRVTKDSAAQNARQAGDRIAHAGRSRRRVALKAVQSTDCLVLVVQPVVIGDGAGAHGLLIGVVARDVGVVVLGIGERPFANSGGAAGAGLLEPLGCEQLDLVEPVEVELLGDRQGFGDRDQHALERFEICLVIAVRQDRAGRRQVDHRSTRQGIAAADDGDLCLADIVADVQLGLALEFIHPTGDADLVADLHVGEEVAVEDEDAFGRQRVAVRIRVFLLHIETLQVARGVGIAILEIADHDPFDDHDLADQGAGGRGALHRADQRRGGLVILDGHDQSG